MSGVFFHRIGKNPSDCVHSDGIVLLTVLFCTKKICRNGQIPYRVLGPDLKNDNYVFL